MPNWIYSPLAVAYNGVTSFRNLLFDTGVFPSKKYDIPIIGIGNLSTGGTGKSPHTIYLVNLLQIDYKIAVISRGYGRNTKGVRVANYESNYQEIGDEPLQIFERFRNKIVVIVSEIRTQAIDMAIEKYQCNLAVLDDSFQHRYVNPGLKILITAYNDLYVDDYILPLGNLRESRINARRADIVIVSKCPDNMSEDEKIEIEKRLKIRSHQRLFFSHIQYSSSVVNRNSEIYLDELEEAHIVLVTGIANAQPLVSFLNKKVQSVTQLEFKDHHTYSHKDVDKIYETMQSMKGEKIILTTEKDYMRLRQFDLLQKYLYYLPIEIKLDNAESFHLLIKKYAHQNS